MCTFRTSSFKTRDIKKKVSAQKGLLLQRKPQNELVIPHLASNGDGEPAGEALPLFNKVKVFVASKNVLLSPEAKTGLTPTRAALWFQRQHRDNDTMLAKRLIKKRISFVKAVTLLKSHLQKVIKPLSSVLRMINI